MDNVVKEFDLKLNKVYQYQKIMQKNYEEEMNKMVKMMVKLERKILEKKFELLVSGDIVDKLVLYGIYGINDNGYKFLKFEKN